MKLIIHDLTPEEGQKLLLAENAKVISDNGTIHPCTGCFGCWIKTPAQCVIRDPYGNMGELLSKCDELTLISRCTYGGFSPFVKNVLDRSISYIHPYFTITNGEMHHRKRYRHSFGLSACFYGDDITEPEKKIARDLVHSNSVNLGCTVTKIVFAVRPEEFGEKMK